MLVSVCDLSSSSLTQCQPYWLASTRRRTRFCPLAVILLLILLPVRSYDNQQLFFFFNYLRVELAKRLRALTLKLLPVEVDPESLTDPTSRVITHKVVSAYRAAGGDFEHAVSPLFFSEAFCHLRFSSRDSLWPDESCLNVILILAMLFFVAAVLLATCS